MFSNLFYQLMTYVIRNNSSDSLRKYNNPVPQVPIIDLAPSDWNSIPSDISDALIKTDIHSYSCLYRSFSTQRLEHVLQYGTDRDNTSSMWELEGAKAKPEDVIWGISNTYLFTAGPRSQGVVQDGVWCIAAYELGKLTFIPATKKIPKKILKQIPKGDRQDAFAMYLLRQLFIPGKGGYHRNNESPLAILRIQISEQMIQSLNYKL